MSSQSISKFEDLQEIIGKMYLTLYLIIFVIVSKVCFLRADKSPSNVNLELIRDLEYDDNI